jgi:hypothetical protein
MNKNNDIIPINNLSDTRMNSIIKNALYYYDSNQDNIIKLLKKIYYFEMIKSNYFTKKIKLYDIKKNILLESSYEIAAIFNPNTSIWKWAWSISNLDKQYTNISRKIFDYAINLDPINEFLLRDKLITSDIKIFNELQFDIFVSLASYISRSPFILKMPFIATDTIEGTNKSEIFFLNTYRNTFNFITESSTNTQDKIYPLIILYYISEYKN